MTSSTEYFGWDRVGRYDRSTRRTVTLTIQHDAPWIRQLEIWAGGFTQGDAPYLRYVMRRVLQEGVLVTLRNRFVAKASRAQMIQFRQAAARSGLSVLELAAKRTALMRAQRALGAAVERGSGSRMTEAQDRIDSILADMEEAKSKAQGESATARSQQLTLAAIGAGLFRQRQAQVLVILTQNARFSMGPNGLMLGVGNKDALNMIKTPSATRWLRGVETKSPLNVFWRHLEWGTGHGRIPDATNNPLVRGLATRDVISMDEARGEKKPGRRNVAWYYGGLGMYGSQGMAFMFASPAGMKEYAAAAQRQFEQAMAELAPKGDGIS